MVRYQKDQKNFEGKRRQEKYHTKRYERRKQKLRIPLEVGEEVLVLSSRIKKKETPGKFYKSSVNNKTYFYRNNIFQITNRKKIDGKNFYWVKNRDNKKKFKFRLQREELFALSGNFQ